MTTTMPTTISHLTDPLRGRALPAEGRLPTPAPDLPTPAPDLPTPAPDLPTPAPDLPIPARMRRLPRERGFVVPWFVARMDDGPAGAAHDDFRVLAPGAISRAVKEARCWLCGHPITAYKTFVVGPMCAINRTSSEPPSHTECAVYAVRACPFLTQREGRRRRTGLPDDVTKPAGLSIDRQPGVALLWTTRRDTVEVIRPQRGVLAGGGDVGGGVLFTMGDPVAPGGTTWWREGRAATRAEVLASVESGYPLLLAEAEAEGPAAVAALERQRAALDSLLPRDVPPSGAAEPAAVREVGKW